MVVAMTGGVCGVAVNNSRPYMHTYSRDVHHIERDRIVEVLVASHADD